MNEVTACPAAITAATLSAWRDQQLTKEESAQLQTHVTSCAACQRLVQAFAAIPPLLQRQHIPVPDSRLWRGVAATIATRDQPRRDMQPGTIWRNVAITLVTTVVISIFVYMLNQRTHHVSLVIHPTASPSGASSPAPTSTVPVTVIQASGSPIVGHTLPWQQVSLPADFTISGQGSPVAVAPGDGNTAYACYSVAGAIHIIVTHDHAAHWVRQADLPTTGTCGNINVDGIASNILVVATVAAPQSNQQYISFDGGQSWQQPAGLKQTSVSALSTYQGQTYAIIGGSTPITHIAVSRDHLQTWQITDASVSHTDIASLWVNPTSGAVLTSFRQSTGFKQGDEQQLWHSIDGGQHWTKINAPTLPSEQIDILVGVVQHSQQWLICVPPQDAGPPQLIFCSGDDGKSWTQMPTLTLPNGQSTIAHGILTDGSLFAETVTSAGAAATMYILPTNATRWQSVGSVPAGNPAGYMAATFFPTSTGGVFWSETAYRPQNTQPLPFYIALYP